VRPVGPSRAVVITVLLLAGASAHGGAQTDPAAVARAVLAADSSGDWATLLRLAHPDALRQFRALQVFQLRMMGDTARPPGDAFEVDSVQHRRFAQRRMEYQRIVLDSVFRVPDVDALARLPSDTVFARWMRALETDDSARAGIPRSRARLVGVLLAGDTLAYAVVVRSIPRLPGPLPQPFRDLPPPEENPEVMVLRRLGDEWRSMLDGTLLGDARIAEDPAAAE